MTVETLLSVGVTLLGVLLNAAVTYGVMSTKLEWLRRDIDRVQDTVGAAHDRIDALITKPPAQRGNRRKAVS